MGKKSRDKLTRAAAKPAATPVSAMRWTPREWSVVTLFAVLTFAVFGQVASHEFLNYDDGQFIVENAHVLSGLSGDSIGWALTSAEIGWYPLTWLSHMLDVTLWGQRAGMHLLTNVLLHLASACLLFAALRLLTRSRWPSAFVAALFAVHPMHVESVAWASERKDTLSTLFIMLALFFYARDPRRKLPVAAAMAASLAAKQMYVTFAPVLLLLDWWPLGRLRDTRELAQRAVEKLPLFALSLIGCVVAVVGQRNLNALQSNAYVSFGDRLANAVVAYVRYLGKLFVPIDMALPYPFSPIGAGEAVAAALLLAAITAGALALRKRVPSLLMGWLWFVGVLVPVIGLVQIGAQSIADRYTYFSYVGLFIALAFGALSLPIPRRALAAIAALIVAIYAAVAFRQVRYWRNSETLFAHTVAVTRDNAQAEYLLGQTLQMSDPDRALPHLRRAIDITGDASGRGVQPPDWYTQSFVGIGTAELMKARAMPLRSSARESLIRDAEAQYRRALSIDPNAPHAKNNITIAQQMLAQGQPAAANSASAHLDAAVALSQQHRYDDALAEYRKAVDAAPDAAEPHVYYGLGLLQAKQNAGALAELQRAKAIDAAQANRVLTRALRMQESPRNLDGVIAQLGGR